MNTRYELHSPVHTVGKVVTDDLRIRPLEIVYTGTVALIRPGIQQGSAILLVEITCLSPYGGRMRDHPVWIQNYSSLD
jgi:hypothetical protein